MSHNLHDTLSRVSGTLLLDTLQEITESRRGLPASSVCEFDGTLTLGDALRKDFSRMSGYGATQAFPTHQFAAKMAFLHVFNHALGSTYRPRRKQVTVTTTRRTVKQQPSKARLAYLVAREMNKYLNEYNLRRQPFPYTLNDIVLRSIDLESRGTFRPRLFVSVRAPRGVRSTATAAC